jgi:hypothetical protein
METPIFSSNSTITSSIPGKHRGNVKDKFIGLAIVLVCVIFIGIVSWWWGNKQRNSPSISIYVSASARLTETDENRNLELVATISEPSAQGASGEFAVVGGNATQSDYSLKGATFHFGPCNLELYNRRQQAYADEMRKQEAQASNENRQFDDQPFGFITPTPGCEITAKAEVVLNGNKIEQPDREFVFGFKNLRNLQTSNRATKTLTLVDDDAPLNGGVPPTLNFKENPYTVKEDSKNNFDEIVLSHQSSFPITYSIMWSRGAKPGEKYFYSAGSQQIPPKQNRGFFTIIPVNDNTCEPNRDAYFIISDVENAVLPEIPNGNEIHVVIQDDDCS